MSLALIAGEPILSGEMVPGTVKAVEPSRSEFETMRGELLEVGLIKWVNPEYKQQGLELTQAGKMFFEKLIRSE